jgi:hypothetical protein
VLAGRALVSADGAAPREDRHFAATLSGCAPLGTLPSSNSIPISHQPWRKKRGAILPEPESLRSSPWPASGRARQGGQAGSIVATPQFTDGSAARLNFRVKQAVPRPRLHAVILTVGVLLDQLGRCCSLHLPCFLLAGNPTDGVRVDTRSSSPAVRPIEGWRSRTQPAVLLC